MRRLRGIAGWAIGFLLAWAPLAGAQTNVDDYVLNFSDAALADGLSPAQQAAAGIADVAQADEWQFLARSFVGFHDLDGSGTISTGDTFTDYIAVRVTNFTGLADNNLTPLTYGSGAGRTHEITLLAVLEGTQVGPNNYEVERIVRFDFYFDGATAASGNGFTPSSFSNFDTFDDGVRVESARLIVGRGVNRDPVLPDGTLSLILSLDDRLAGDGRAPFELRADGSAFEPGTLIGLVDANNLVEDPTTFEPTMAALEAKFGFARSDFDLYFGTTSDGSFNKQAIEPPCIDLEKQVWDGAMWQDADTEAEAVMLADGALYRLVVTNCGSVPLANVLINDPDLGIVDYLVGDLAPGQEVVITEILVGGVNLLADPDICESGPGPYLNTACAEGTYAGILVEDCDPAWVECPPEFACRVTAGGNKDGVYCPLIQVRKNVFEPDPQYCNVEEFTKDITHTWGGQAGAPPRVDGNWTHKYNNNSVNPADHFTFHSNDVRWIQCSDPGEFCSPARFAPNRQIDFSGYGVFTNGKGQFNALAGKTEYCFMVHLEDIGEPGPGGRWPSATEPCSHCPGTEVVEPDCVNCTDYYSIEIYSGALNEATGACSGTLIWRNGRPSDNCGAMEDWVAPYAPYEGNFIRAGNVQMHPDNNGP